jgi:LPXTG-motif cell wall-anchored protein
MHAWIRRALCAVGVTGGIVLLGFGLAEAASADGNSGPVTTGQNGILSGNQTAVDAQAPVNLSGNQVTVIGHDNKATSVGGATTGASTANGGGGSPTTSGQNGIASGNQTAVGLQVPVNASGNQVTVIGDHNTAQSVSGTSTSGGSTPATTGATAGPTTTGQDGLLSGNQTGIGIGLPINLSGNQVTVIGHYNTVTSASGSTTSASTTGGSTGGGALGGATTSGKDGIGSGNQTGLAVLAPVAATGNQVTVIGDHNTVSSTGGSTTGGSTTGGSTGPTTTGEGGIGSGNQTPIVVQVPVDTSGNQVTVVGHDNTVTSTGGSSTGGGTTPVSTPSGGVVVSPPTSAAGGTPSGPQGGLQAAAGPGETVLPNTGAGRELLALAVLGLMLLSAGLVLGRPRRRLTVQ